MNLHQNPDLLDRLAAAHALGTLRGGARRRFEAMARQNPAVRATALLWQERLAAMTELQPSVAPDPNVWKRIENLLRAERPGPATPQPETAGWRRAARWWRVATLGTGLAAIAALGMSLYLIDLAEMRDVQLARAAGARANLMQQNAQLTAQLQARPDIQYVSVLADDKSMVSMLVTFDLRKGTLTVKRVGTFQEAPDKSLQLWALRPAAAPQSLGVLDRGAVITLPAAESQVKQVPALAISLEPKGGVPAGRGPSGPVLFSGALLPTT